MNKERLEELAAHLNKLPRGDFDMYEWYPGCSTACCIGGYAERLFGKQGRILGLIKAYESTPKQAAKVIRHLIKTGKVEWERFVP